MNEDVSSPRVLLVSPREHEGVAPTPTLTADLIARGVTVDVDVAAAVKARLASSEYTAVIAPGLWATEAVCDADSRALKIVDLRGARLDADPLLMRQWDVVLCRSVDDVAALEPLLRPTQRALVVSRAPQPSHDETDHALVALLQERDEAPAPGVISPTVRRRLATIIDALGFPPLVLWGNGSHTRALVAVLQSLGARIRGIVDKSAAVEGVSQEHIRVLPAQAFTPAADDVIVLSSQTYEHEMWRDLAGLRARGAHVVAVHRRDLVTDAIGRRLRQRSKRLMPSGHERQSCVARLVIAEPSAGRSRGPFFRLAHSLSAAGANAGIEIIVAGARKPARDAFEPRDHALWRPAFEFAHWDVLRELDASTWRAVARMARFMTSDLKRLTDRLTLGRNDVVLLNMANLIDVLSAADWLGSTPAHSMPGVRLLFHFLPAQEAQWLRLTEDEVVHAYRLALGQLMDRAGDRAVLLAQNTILAERLSVMFDLPVGAMGFPVVPAIGTRSRDGREGTACVLYAGEARADKGFGWLPAIADALSDELHSGRLRLVCQSPLNEYADDRIVAAVRTLSARPGVNVIDRFLPSHEYDELVAGCDAVLLPYDPAQYRARLSAIFVDATCAGVPVIVPSGTWLSAQLEEGLGTGRTYDDLTPDAIAGAIRDLLSSLPSLARDAHEAAARARHHHDPRVVLETILGTGSIGRHQTEKIA